MTACTPEHNKAEIQQTACDNFMDRLNNPMTWVTWQERRRRALTLENRYGYYIPNYSKLTQGILFAIGEVSADNPLIPWGVQPYASETMRPTRLDATHGDISIAAADALGIMLSDMRSSATLEIWEADDDTEELPEGFRYVAALPGATDLRQFSLEALQSLSTKLPIVDFCLVPLESGQRLRVRQGEISTADPLQPY